MFSLNNSDISKFKPCNREAINITGLDIMVGKSGLKPSGLNDTLIIVFSEESSVSGIFTKSTTASCVVDWCKRCIKEHSLAKALIVHSGNSNTFTGKQGKLDLEHIVKLLSTKLNCQKEQIYVAATGIIGETLPIKNVLSEIERLFLEKKYTNFTQAAETIMTTDTFPKYISKQFTINKEQFTITGITKGSGMIMPDMATMLCFIFTDFHLPGDIAQKLVTLANLETFRCVTVDGDTSTSDTLLLFSTNKQKLQPPISNEDDARIEIFYSCLQEVMSELSLDLVRDGEGVNKMINVKVIGASCSESARKIAMSVANSPLVKTAVAGGHPNWGRVIMAIGKTGELVNKESLRVWFGKYDLCDFDNLGVNFSRKQELVEYMKEDKIEIRIDVSVGDGKASVWTSDLTEKYIDINARYLT